MSARNGSVTIKRWTGPRSRSRPKGETATKLRNVPSMKEFLHKQTIVRQYRGFMRAVATIPDEKWRIQARDEVRNSFALHKNETNNIAISMATKEGERKLKELHSMVGYASFTTQSDADSWLNIDDKDDPRGRIGIEWPWDTPGSKA